MLDQLAVPSTRILPTPAAPAAAGGPLEEGQRALLLEALTAFSLVWSVGCTADGEGRTKFDAFFRAITSGQVPPGYEECFPNGRAPKLAVGMMPAEAAPAPGAAPQPCSVYDFVFDQQSLSWKLWTATIPAASIPADAQFSDIIVPTKDSAR
jgi:dynein heavy chain